MSTPLPTAGLKAVHDLEPISSLAPEQIAELLALSVVESLDAGTTLARSDKPERQSIYLLRGDVEQNAGGALRLIRSGSPAALHPVIDEQTRPETTTVTVTPATIIRIDLDQLDRLLTWAQITVPEESVVMAEGRIITVNKADWLKTMIKSPTFRNLPPASIEELLHRLEPIFAGAGEVIIRQGDQGDYFYMIDQGTVLVMHNPDNDEDQIEIAELNEGATFGEAALLSDNPRNATVSMRTDGILLRLSKEDFNKLLRQPSLQWLDIDEARLQVGDDGAWIDVRLPAEYEHSHLAGAINIPMPALHRTARTLDRKKHYICYCQTGRRSSAAAFVLKQYGLDASVLVNGLQQVPDALLQRA